MSLEDLFLAALDQPDAKSRDRYLEQACNGDAGIRGQVDELLAAHYRSGEFLDVPAIQQVREESGAENTVTMQGESVSSRDHDTEELSFLSPSQRLDSLGRIGHYEVLQVLGKGGFGIVFRAFDDVLQRVVAIKVMAPQLAATSPARKRFLREARTSAQVRHENVVQVYEVAEHPLPYLAMEFIPGETLQQKLDRNGPLEVSETLRIGRQIAEGLAAAHARDLIHRDIKPANVLIEGGPRQQVKITDFGLARAADDASISQSGIIAGTPMYMAPEQAQGQTLDQRADLFSLGSVLYQMAAGRPPFRANNTVAVLKRVCEDTPRAIREIIPETPQWLCDIIAKLHAKDPEDRYQSAREVSDVLADCESQLKANSKLKDFSRIPRGKSSPRRTVRQKWIAAATVLLLPMFALAVTEFAGVTNLFRGQQATPDPVMNAEGAGVRRERPAGKGTPADFTNTLGMQFELIPAGKFTMGSPMEEIDRFLGLLAEDGWRKERVASEGPEHVVEITQPFSMGTTQVTVGQFRQFVDDAGSQSGDARWRNLSVGQTDNHPVVWVTWENAVDFCKWLSKKEGRTYRLPTEAEWEYSCRAGKSGTRYCYGDDDGELKNYGWYKENSGGGTHPVGKKKPNEWGLYDMHGNAGEWCHDRYDPNYYKTSPKQDPPGPGTGDERVLRGGTWSRSEPFFCRSAFRNHDAPESRYDDIGFRVVLVGDLNVRTPPIDVAKKLPPTFKNTLGMEFAVVPKGKSWLGGGKDKLGD